MDWKRGYVASYYATTVDPVSWKDTGTFQILEGSVTKESTALKESASLTCREYDATRERWVRIYLTAKQGDGGDRIPIFTGLATSPQHKSTGAVSEYPLECYSVLKPADDILLQRGWYAPAGISATEILRELLSYTPCPVEILTTPKALDEPIISEDGETALSMTDKILDALGWRTRIQGDGTVEIVEVSTMPVETFSENEACILEPEIEITYDWFECPNVFRAVSGDMAAVARDDDSASPISTVNRGREVWQEETSCDLADGQTLAQYATDKLKELQTVYMTANYPRRYIPNITVTDTIKLNFPSVGLLGTFRIDSQTIDLKYAGKTEEAVSYVG